MALFRLTYERKIMSTDNHVITAPANKKIRFVRDLLQKGKVRDKFGLFAAEGRHLFDEAPDGQLQEIYVAASYYEEIAGQAAARRVPVYTVEDRLFDKISDTKTPQGVLCIVKKMQCDPQELLAQEEPLFLLLDQIRDPGNLGTIIRMGEAAGVDGIWLSDGCADPYQPKVVRSAMGALYRMPLVICSAEKTGGSTAQEAPTLGGVLNAFKEAGVRLYGSSLQASRPYDEPDYTRATAFVIGNESHGVREEVLGRCDERIIIPMKGKVESLNAAIAATLMAFEAARQRG